MTIWAIGDVQGCAEPLARLVDAIDFDPVRDRLWFVGDLVNRGPDSAGVLRFVRRLGDAATSVLGNHDLHLLAVASGARPPRPDDTLASVLAAADRDELLDWLRRLPLVHAADGHVLVHAGLLPGWSVARALALSAEVQAALVGPQGDELLRCMYGGVPAAWEDHLTGWDRLRVIINATTRMRFCTPTGTMEFHHKGPPGKAPAGHLPWFQARGAWQAAHRAVFGHWSALGFHRDQHAVGLDTGCVWGGALSAFSLEGHRLVQVPARPA